MFKIFYNNKILLLSESATADNSFTKIYFLEEEKIKNGLKFFIENETSLNLNIYGDSFKKLPDFILSQFKIINAAGGVVLNDKKDVLYIFRRDYYDFPKGKLEDGESVKEGALREVCEECGILITDLKIVKPITNIYHIYKLNSQNILKNTTWFLMKYSGNYNLTPQTEEDITEIGWINKSELNKFRLGTYPSLIDLLDMITEIV
ncbi:MAG TPA: NUDIX domain-containing protein [Bacteroidales bacterium]|nr:NUDIX domain-containing protein [Bacteroidales bacterium]